MVQSTNHQTFLGRIFDADHVSFVGDDRLQFHQALCIFLEMVSQIPPHRINITSSYFCSSFGVSLHDEMVQLLIFQKNVLLYYLNIGVWNPKLLYLEKKVITNGG